MNKWKMIAAVACTTSLMLGIFLSVANFFILRALDGVASEVVEDSVEHAANLAEFGASISEAIERFDKDQEPWVECALPHPRATPAILFMQQRIHSIQAEYEYKLRIGSGANVVERILPLNVGGRTKMNVYWLADADGFGDCLKLRNQWGEYLFRFKDQKTYRMARLNDRTYIGEITHSRYHFSVVGELAKLRAEETERKQSTPDEVVDDNGYVGADKAIDVTEKSVAKRGKYLGSIDGSRVPLRFITAEEAEEIQVEVH